jgi:RNA polymerase sigma factor (sigma-70 family)
MRGGLGGFGDDELAALATDGDGRAFDVLCERYRDRLHGYCFQLLGDRDAAEDAVQDAVVRAWQGLGRRSRRTGFRDWLFAITRNVAIDATTRRQVGTEVSVKLDGLPAREGDVIEQVGVRMQMAELWGDLRALPMRQRDALTLHEVFGVSFEQIAALRGGTAKAARQAAIDGRKGLGVAAVGRERSCGEVQGVLAALDRRGRRQGWVAAHLRGCASCRSFERGVGKPGAGGWCWPRLAGRCGRALGHAGKGWHFVSGHAIPAAVGKALIVGAVASPLPSGVAPGLRGPWPRQASAVHHRADRRGLRRTTKRERRDRGDGTRPATQTVSSRTSMPLHDGRAGRRAYPRESVLEPESGALAAWMVATPRGIPRRGRSPPAGYLESADGEGDAGGDAGRGLVAVHELSLKGMAAACDVSVGDGGLVGG